MKLLGQLKAVTTAALLNDAITFLHRMSLLKMSFSTEIYIEKMCPLNFFSFFLLLCISLAFLFLKFLLDFVVFLFFSRRNFKYLLAYNTDSIDVLVVIAGVVVGFSVECFIWHKELLMISHEILHFSH